MAVANPALEKFVAQLGHELVLAQVFIRRRSAGYELRHADDRDRPEAELRPIPPAPRNKRAGRPRRPPAYSGSRIFRFQFRAMN